jgi:serine/threonine protein kinase
MPELTLPPPASVPFLGEGLALGVWRLCESLHASASGQWYRAVHSRAANQEATVLVMHRGEQSASALLRFADHASELARFHHPDIAVPGDSGVTSLGQPYLVLGAVRGQPIQLACADLPLRKRLALVVELCELLRHVHQQGWLLNEIDPAMVWVNDEGEVVLMGLGLIHMPDPEEPFERGRVLSGLPGFMSPEQRAGHPPSLAAEVYGLGALLYSLVDGRLPGEFGDGVEDASPSAPWGELSMVERLSLDALMRKAVSPHVARRQPCAEVLADDLRAWLAGGNHSGLSLTPMPETVAPQGAQRGEHRRTRLLLAGLGLAVLLAVGWAGRGLMDGKPDPAGPAAAAPVQR